jgi:hypothetical protein
VSVKQASRWFAWRFLTALAMLVIFYNDVYRPASNKSLVLVAWLVVAALMAAVATGVRILMKKRGQR